MKGALGLGADERIDLLVGAHLLAGLYLTCAVSIEGRLGEDLARETHAGAHLDPVLFTRHVIEEDDRLIRRRCRSQPHPSGAARAHGPDVRLKAVLLCE